MRLLDAGQLGAALITRLKDAKTVDIAVAWVRTSEALRQIQAASEAGVKIRAIVGLAGNVTEPIALRLLQRFCELRIANDTSSRAAPGGIFHPKVFVFSYTGGEEA